MDRPQLKRISVAIMGWIRNTETNVPLNSINMIVPRQQTMIPRMTEPSVMLLPPFSTFTKKLPAMAPTAPTEISCPPQAAVTSVIPMEIIARALALSMMLIRLPLSTELPLLLTAMPMAKKE